MRANAQGDRRAIQLNREAVALDSTFASAWSSLGATLSNYGGTRSAIDSAVTQAYRYRDRLPARERDLIVGRYYSLGPGRDRAKAIEAYAAILQRGDSTTAAVNLGESLRSRREYARAESLNLAAARIIPGNGTALGNAIEMQLNQGKLKEAAATLARLQAVSVGYGTSRRLYTLYAQGDDKAVRALADSLARSGGDTRAREMGISAQQKLALRDGRLGDFERLLKEALKNSPAPRPDDAIFAIWLDVAVKGPSKAVAARLDAAIAKVPFRESGKRRQGARHDRTLPRGDDRHVAPPPARGRLARDARRNRARREQAAGGVGRVPPW